MAKYGSFRNRFGGFKRRFKGGFGRFRNKFRSFGRKRFRGRRGSASRSIINAPFRIIRRPLGRASGRNWMGISVAGWLLLGVLAFLFIKPFKAFVQGIFHKK